MKAARKVSLAPSSQALNRLGDIYLNLWQDQWDTLVVAFPPGQMMKSLLTPAAWALAPTARLNPLFCRRPQRPCPALTVHAGLTLAQWGAAQAALPFFAGQTFPATSPFESLRQEIHSAGLPLFQQSLSRQVKEYTAALLQGTYAYLDHPYQRELPLPPVLWKKGSARLYDYAPHLPGAPLLLVVPSLINRPYILDFQENCSLLRYLAHSGLRPVMLDWGEPGPLEANYGLEAYFQEILQPAYEAVLPLSPALMVMGYCIGGLLAAALAERYPAIRKLALLATPGDFSHHTPLPSSLLDHLKKDETVVAPEILQALFYGLNPPGFFKKFQRFQAMEPESSEAHAFVALEDWINDGVALSHKTALECFEGWFQDNAPYRGEWVIAGRPVTLAQVSQPAWVIAGEQDRFVPPASAQALASQLPVAQLNQYDYSHTGLMTHPEAAREVWQPLRHWLQEL